MAAPSEVQELVRLFRGSQRDWRQANEATTRLELINPFFAALGWDVLNRQGRSRETREVVHEAALLVDGRTKAPDYLIRAGQRNRFYIEAKRPAVNVSEGQSAAYQIRRYGWNARIPFGIVTDFEEFAVYDCRLQPAVGDSAYVSRVRYLMFQEYDEQWDWISGTFSRDAVLAGSLDRLADDAVLPRATRSVDVAFLEEMKGWRLLLAQDLARRNQALTEPELNFAVTAIIDRIVFLRIAEARGLEPQDVLLNLTRGAGIYGRLTEVFQRADARYNSGLFHFRNERGRAQSHDDLTLSLTITDEPLRHILSRLYYPEPYEFAAISSDILGQTYEQFLGQVITLDDSHQAQVETKMEVRKAGGVYYTPQYIVEYIVERTLGTVLKGLSVARAADIKILDPACGSGSFLIVAYQYLLDWHLSRYLQNPTQNQRFLENDASGLARLSTAERKRILVNNIFGVDIDSQAVEVTKLSLLLKVIEGDIQMSLDVGRLLPDLDQNIKCGNSLIAPDLPQPEDMTDKQWAAYKPFSWDAAFPATMQRGGFDAVIGNPPYLNVDDTWGRQDPRLAYLKAHYADVYADKTDLLFYFLELSVRLSRAEIGAIVSRAFLDAHKAEKLRHHLGNNTAVREIIDFRNAIIFKNVGITTTIVHLTKTPYRGSAAFRQLIPRNMPTASALDDLANTRLFTQLEVAQRDFGASPWRFAPPALRALFQRIDTVGDPVGTLLSIGQGMQTGQNRVFQGLDLQTLQDASTGAADYYYLRARNSDIGPYRIGDSGIGLIYTENATHFHDLPQRIQTHLRANEGALTERAAYERGNCKWWQYTWPLHKQRMHRPKILSPYMASSNRFAIDMNNTYLGLTDTTILYDNNQPEDLRYIVGVLNSRLLTLRYQYLGKLKAGGVLEYFENMVSKLPIPRRSPGDSHHDEIVRLVDRITGPTARLDTASTPADRSALANQIEAVRQDIDRVVYRVFGLVEADILLINAEMAVSEQRSSI